MMIATIIGSNTSSTISSILTDHLSGSSILTNASGTIIEQTDYYPFGGTRIDTQTGGNEQRKFIGEMSDGNTGLSYLHARYYDGVRGGFLSEDPVFLENPNKQDLLNPQNLNSYSYALNNPIIKSDPNGRCFGPLLIACAYAVATAPVWAPVAVTTIAAAGLVVTAPLVGGATYSYVKGDQAMGDGMMSGAMTVMGGVAAGASEAMMMSRVDRAGLQSTAQNGMNQTTEVSTKIHGNSLDSPKLNYGYQLIDKGTGNVLKYGITGKENPFKRYSNPVYDQMNARMEILTSGSKSEMRSWETGMIKAFEKEQGVKPKLNKTYH